MCDLLIYVKKMLFHFVSQSETLSSSVGSLSHIEPCGRSLLRTE